MCNKKRNILDMLQGCKNRMSITDNEEELERLYKSAQYWLGELLKYRQNEFETAKLQAKKVSNE